MFGEVVCVFGVGFEGYFGRTEGTFYVESEDLSDSSAKKEGGRRDGRRERENGVRR